jgi:hypothetical protein
MQSIDPIVIEALSRTQDNDMSYVSKSIQQTHYEKEQLSREGPYLIADYLAQNSSKSAAVFRRYDKLAMHRLIRLSRELRVLENEHDECVKNGLDLESHDSEQYSRTVGKTVTEYCTCLLHTRTIQENY